MNEIVVFFSHMTINFGCFFDIFFHLHLRYFLFKIKFFYQYLFKNIKFQLFWKKHILVTCLKIVNSDLFFHMRFDF